jgi:hypothetical protein
MEIKIICTNQSCQQQIAVDDSRRGQLVECPECGSSSRVPSAKKPPLSAGVKVLLWGLTGIAAAAALTAFAVAKHRHQAAEMEQQQREVLKMREAAAATTPPVMKTNRPLSFLNNPLWVMSTTGDVDGIKALLDKQPERLEEQIGGMHATMLHAAACLGQPAAVEELLKRGANVNARTKEGHTPLYDCIYGRGTTEIAEMLIESRADINLPDYKGVTPLQLATTRGKKDIADLLRQHGAKK